MKLHAPEIKTLIELCNDRIEANTEEQEKANVRGNQGKVMELQLHSEYIASIREVLEDELTRQLKGI